MGTTKIHTSWLFISSSILLSSYFSFNHFHLFRYFLFASNLKPDFLGYKCHATYCGKALNDGYNFASHLISIKGLHTKLWAPKVAKVPSMRISRLPLGNREIKWHLGASPVAKHMVYYKGEGGGFPQVRAMVSFVSLCLLVVYLCTKVL